MAEYLFGEHVYSPEHVDWQRVLKKAHMTSLRPVCRCLPHGQHPVLYVANVHGQFVLKRMPFSGAQHAPHCPHYEPPPELSGLGQVHGSAIREELETQTTTLLLDFPLKKGHSKQAPAINGGEQDSARSDGTRLTMRGLTHYLFDQAGLTRWTPAMTGKRSWFVVRREILQAAGNKFAKGQSLGDLLFVPETFNSVQVEEHRGRQAQALAPLSASTSARMLLLGEVKAVEDARFGKCLVIKHLPELKFMMADELYRRMVARFAVQLQLWSQLGQSHLITLCSISRSAQGVLSIEAACLINVNENWLPFESLFEWQLLDALHGQGRRFSKGLRYNLALTRPLASAVLQDTGERPTALFVVPAGLEAAYGELVADMLGREELQAWQWIVGAESMPPLP